MNWAAVISNPALRWIARIWPAPAADSIETLTGLDAAGWTSLARRFPALGSHPGTAAARARRTFALVAWHALGRRRGGLWWEPTFPGTAPCVYLTIHLGNLRVLRYLMRKSGIPVATVVDETHLGSPQWRKSNDEIDRRTPHDLPHTLSAREPHRLRSALRRGSLIIAIDRIHPPPPGAADDAVAVPFLGGMLDIELAPLRLARVAAVPARPIFISAPGGRLTIATGAPLPADPAAAAAQFAESLGRVAGRSPADFDGYTHRFLVSRSG